MRNILNFFGQKTSTFSIAFLLAATLALLAGCGSGVATTTTTGPAPSPTMAVQLYDASGAVVTSVSPSAAVTVKATLKDGAGAGIPNTVVTFSVTDATLATVSPSTALTDSSGVATITLSTPGTASGATSVTASAPVGTATITGTTSFAVISLAVTTAPKLSLQITNSAGTVITAISPSAPGTIKATLKDASGTAIPGTVVTFSITDATKATIAPLTALTDASGVATASLTAKGFGATTISATAQVGTTTVNASTSFSTTISTPSLSLSLSTNTISTGSPAAVKATLVDGTGTAVTNAAVTFDIANTTLATVTPASAQTNLLGVATASLSAVGTTPGTTTISAAAQVNGTTVTSNLVTFSVVSTVATVSSLSLSASSATVKSDNSTVTTITVTALSATNAAIPNVAITLGADTGILSTQTVTTDITGKATFTFSSGTSSKSNRTATISATTGLVSAQLPIQIVGSTLTVNATGSTVPSNGTTPITMTFTAKDAGGNPVPGSTITVTKTAGAGTVTITPVTSPAGLTDSNGQYVVTVAGTGAGAVTVTGNALGVTAAAPVTVTSSAITFGIAESLLIPAVTTPCGTGGLCVTTAAGSPTITTANTGSIAVGAHAAGAGIPLNVTVASIVPNASFNISANATASASVSAQIGILNPLAVTMQIGDSLVVLVNAPTTTNVTFATTMGTWAGGTNTKSVAVVAGTVCGPVTTLAYQACAILTDPAPGAAGLANVQVYDTAATVTSASLTVSMTATTPNKVTLQASPSLVGKCVGTTCPFSTLVATVTDLNNLPVGNVPVAFSIVNPTGGGENVSPVVVNTATTTSGGLSLGQARTTFTAGSLSSSAPGVKVRASVLGTAVVTNTAPSGNDAAIVIGGTAGSIAFGSAATLGVTGAPGCNTGSPDSCPNYVQPMSVLVTDSNGNPAPAGTVVNLSAWPIAWSTGAAPCVPDYGVAPGPVSGSGDNNSGSATTTTGTFINEDINENLYLDANEDGGWNATAGKRTFYYSKTATTASGTQDTLLTPASSSAGSVPGTVTTDATGFANFNLIYPKTSALWIVTRIRAQTVVQGSSALSEIQFRLPALESDAKPPTVCHLGSSPYRF